MADDLRKLKDEAALAVEKGKHRRAAELYEKLSEMDPDPLWPHRAGEALRRAGAGTFAIPILMRAADGYARQGFLLKAIAVCKMILEIDKNHSSTQEMLAALYAKRLTPVATAASQPVATPNAPVAQPYETGRSPAPPPITMPPVAPPPQREVRHTIPLELGDLTLNPPREVSDPSIVLDLPREDRSGVGPPAAVSAPNFHEPSSGHETIDALHLNKVVPGSRSSSEFPAMQIPLDNSGELQLPEEAAPELPRIPLFSSLGEEHLRRLIERVVRVEAPMGQVIVRQGDEGRALYVIVRGTVEISVLTEGVVKPMGELVEGEFFGELAVLTKFRRSATVTAQTDAELLSIDRKVIADLIKDSPQVLRVLLRFFRARMIERLVVTSPLFQSLSPAEAKDLTERFQFLEFEPGAVLIQEGKAAPGLFAIMCGACDVVQRQDNREVPLALIGPGEITGEASMIDQAPSTQTVRAKTRLWALGLPRAGFNAVVQAHPQLLTYVNDVAQKRKQRIAKRLI